MKGMYTVALCDILGFTKLIEGCSLDEVVEKPLVWFRKSLGHSIHKSGYPDTAPSLRELLNQSHLGVAWFSDTILLYTLQDTDEHLKALTQTLGWLFFETMFMPRTRLRGGVAYGEAYLDAENLIFAGKPIIEAHRMEQAQLWAGCALAQSAFERIPVSVRKNPLELEDWRLIPYDVPLRERSPQELLVVNWTLGIHERGEDFRWSEDSAEPSPEDWQTNQAVCEKWKNIRQFHRDMCRDCRKSPAAKSWGPPRFWNPFPL